MNFTCDQYHVRPVRAKVVRVIDSPKEPSGAVQPFHVQAKDGRWLWLGQSLCGTHANALPFRSLTADINVLGLRDYLDSPALTLDYIKRLYEARLDALAAKAAEDDARWHERAVAHSKVQHKVVSENPDRWHGLFVLDIVNDGGDTDGKPVSSVSVHVEGGVARVSISDYSGNVGIGRGNADWVKCLREALDRAEAVMNEYNTGKEAGN